MPTSDGSCGICGEKRGKAGDLLWGCVACNPEKERLARQPEVPVNPGDRLGCLQHGKIDCERCGLLETRHRMALGGYVKTADGWNREERDSRASAFAIAFLFLLLAIMVFGCGYAVWENWPR